MKKMGSNKGFTLVELIIVIAILAIIMLIAIPNFSGIQQRMKVRADKATAAQIGKAVRVWYTDYTTDEIFKASIDDPNGDGTGIGKDADKLTTLSTTAVPYNYIGRVVAGSTTEPEAEDEIAGSISAYCSVDYTPSSLLDDGVNVDGQKYFVKLSGNTSDAKIIVEIAADAADCTGSAENYDGTAAGVAYVEP